MPVSATLYMQVPSTLRMQAFSTLCMPVSTIPQMPVCQCLLLYVCLCPRMLVYATQQIPVFTMPVSLLYACLCPPHHKCQYMPLIVQSAIQMPESANRQLQLPSQFLMSSTEQLPLPPLPNPAATTAIYSQ